MKQPTDLLRTYSQSQQAASHRRRANCGVESGLSDVEIPKSEVRVGQILKVNYCIPLAFQERMLELRKGQWFLQSHTAILSLQPGPLPLTTGRGTHVIFSISY